MQMSICPEQHADVLARIGKPSDRQYIAIRTIWAGVKNMCINPRRGKDYLRRAEIVLKKLVHPCVFDEHRVDAAERGGIQVVRKIGHQASPYFTPTGEQRSSFNRDERRHL